LEKVTLGIGHRFAIAAKFASHARARQPQAELNHAAVARGGKSCPALAKARRLSVGAPARWPSQIEISNQNRGLSWKASFCIKTQFIAPTCGLKTWLSKLAIKS